MTDSTFPRSGTFSFSALAGAAVGLAVLVAVPLLLGSGFWLQLLIFAGIASIAALGLNLLTGNTGQVSLGTPFFMGVGAYSAGVFGQDLGLPLPAWLLVSCLFPALIGAAIGPFALRVRGHYLVMATFALVFIGQHLFFNLTPLTGGTTGRPILAPLSLGLLDFAALPGMSREQGVFYLVWALVVLFAWMVRNVLKSRPGRGLMAIRDRDITAEVVGVDVARYKVIAFAVSSGLAGIAGGLNAAFVQYVSPSEWSLLLGIQYLAMIVVGGVGTVSGSIIGPIVLTVLPYGVQSLSVYLPGVSLGMGEPGTISVFALNQILFGILVILFLIVAPHGFAGLLARLRRPNPN